MSTASSRVPRREMTTAVTGVRSPRRHVVVIGAGLTGLATAWRLGVNAELTVLEAGTRAGGMIHTVDFDGTRLDVGADAFLVRRPEAERLVRDLGFGDRDLVEPATGQVLLWHRGRLHRLPARTVFGAPTSISRLAASQVLAPWQILRAGLEPVVGTLGRHRRGLERDVSVGDLVTSRYGRAVTERLVEPLLAGVYAGDVDQLSAQATVPQLWDVAQAGGSMLRRLRPRPAATAVRAQPVFQTVRGGLSRIVDRLVDDLGPAVHLGQTAVAIDAGEPEGRAWKVTTDAGRELEADDVVLAVPSHAARRLLAPIASEAADILGTMRAASVGVVALAYPSSTLDDLAAASGILVGRDEDTIVKAVTFSTRKWPHLAAHPRVLLRASVGRIDDGRALALDDDALIGRVDAEVRTMTGIGEPPVSASVTRWEAALPQYAVGHVEAVDRVRRAVAAAAPGIHLAGAAFDGVGLAARAAEAAALASAISGRP